MSEGEFLSLEHPIADGISHKNCCERWTSLRSADTLVSERTTSLADIVVSTSVLDVDVTSSATQVGVNKCSKANGFHVVIAKIHQRWLRKQEGHRAAYEFVLGSLSRAPETVRTDLCAL